MKKILLVLMMGLVITPSFAESGKEKKKHKKQPKVEQVSEVKPVNRERWVEKSGNYYVIVSRTTITADDYNRIKNSNK